MVSYIYPVSQKNMPCKRKKGKKKRKKPETSMLLIAIVCRNNKCVKRVEMSLFLTDFALILALNMSLVLVLVLLLLHL